MRDVVSDFAEDAQELLTEVLLEYGLAMFVVAQVISGTGLLVMIPDGTVTPTFVLLFADNLLQVVLISTISASALVLGNFILYMFFRLLGDRMLSDERRKTRFWRLMEWSVKKNAKVSLVVLRLIPIGGGLIAIPAGLVKVKIRTFILYSFIGFLIYELILGLGIWYAVEKEFFSIETIYDLPSTV